MVSGYLFNMATIFEDFVTVALREALKSYGGRTSLQHVTHLDDDADVPVRPDFVWLTQGHARIVVDAKYKAEKPTGFPQADLYQMFAYCTVLGLPEGDLVYATKPHAPDRSRYSAPRGPGVFEMRGSAWDKGVRRRGWSACVRSRPGQVWRQIG